MEAFRNDFRSSLNKRHEEGEVRFHGIDFRSWGQLRSTPRRVPGPFMAPNRPVAHVDLNLAGF